MDPPQPAAFLLNNLQVGGSETKTIEVVNRLHARSWPVHLLYLNGPHDLKERISLAIPTTCFERRGKVSLRTIGELRAYVANQGIRTLVAVNLYPQIYAGMVNVGTRNLRTRVVACVNTADHPDWISRAKMIFYGPLIRRADQVIFGSSRQMAQWRSRYGLQASNCEVIYNGVDVDRFAATHTRQTPSEPRRVFGFSPRDFVVGTVGRLEPEKGHVDLLQVTYALRSRIPGLKVLIVGEGSQRAALERRVGELGLQDRVVFAGKLSDVRPALRSMDVFVLPSLAVETFSNAALEAMATGLPVVLSDIGGAGEMVADGVSGLLHTRGDRDALADRLLELSSDPVRGGELGRQAALRVAKEFSVDKMVDRYERMLAGLRCAT